MTAIRLAAWTLAATFVVGGCVEESADLSLPGDGSAARGTPSSAADDGAPCEPGDVDACSIPLGVENGITSCIEGERACRGGAWGPCEGSLVLRPIADDGATQDRFDDAVPRNAERGSVSCEDVCDPDCEAFPDGVPGSATPPSTEVPLPVAGGDRLSFEENVPGPFQDRLLKSPCTGIAGACQTDTHCIDGTCVPFEPEDTRAVGGADLTVGLPCGARDDARIPVCNRGDAPAAAGVQLAFLSSNSSQLQNDLSSCTLPSNRSFSHVCTIPEAIEPGACVMAPSSCSPGLQGNNKAIVVNPRRAAPNAVAAVAEAPGACGNNWSWWDAAVSCDVCTPAVQRAAVPRSGGACAPVTLGSLPTELLTERVVVGALRPKHSAAWTSLTRVQEADGCSGGLEYWIDESQPSVTAHLCPATCDSIAAAPSPDLRLTVECPVTFEPSLEGRIVYEGVCPRGTRTQWRWLSYNALVPGDSRLDIDVRTGESAEIDASFTPVARVDASDDLLEAPVLDTAACLFTDPDDECPVSLWRELGGVPAATNPFLELRWTLTRSTNGRLAPQLHSIEATFTCPDSE